MNGTHANGDIDGVHLKQGDAASIKNVPTTADMSNGAVDGAHEEPTEDPAKALDVLSTYKAKDGISVQELLDETKTGGCDTDARLGLVGVY